MFPGQSLPDEMLSRLTDLLKLIPGGYLVEARVGASTTQRVLRSQSLRQVLSSSGQGGAGAPITGCQNTAPGCSGVSTGAAELLPIENSGTTAQALSSALF